ncbi:MAG: hypothetical protein ACRDTG_29195 [Pseudonocardiaceae bacterium]
MAVVGKATVRVAGPRGAGSLIREGKVYDDDDPLVTARPDLFEDPEDHQRRKARPRSTADLGRRSMAARGLAAGTETARAAPGEARELPYPCPATDCEWRGTSERALKAHTTKAHG